MPMDQVQRQPGVLSRRVLLRTVGIGLAASASAALLAACGGSATATTTTASSVPAASAAQSSAAATTAAAASTTASAAASSAAPAANAPAGSASISVSVWPDVSDLDINKGIIGAFMKQHSGITVSPQQWVGDYYQKLQVGIAGNTVPDMVYFQGWMWQPYAAAGQVLELDSYIGRDKSSLPNDLFPDVDAYTRQLALKGKHYGMPVDSGSMIMYYNKDLFAAANVPVPTSDWTEQDFLGTLDKVQAGLKKAGKNGIFAYQPNYNDPYTRDFPWWRMNGGMEFDQLENPKKAQWTQTQIIAAWQQELHDLSAKGVAISQAALVSGGGSSAYYNYGIQNGLAAMKVEGPWFLPQMWGDKAATKGGINFDVVRRPKGTQGSSMFWQVEPITIWKTSKAPDACWEYLKYAVSPDGQQFVAQGGRMTNTPSSIEQIWAPLVQKLYNFQNAKEFAFSDGASMVETGGVTTDQMGLKGGLNAARDSVLNGSKTAQAALTEANPKIQALLDDWWKSNPNG